MAGDEAKIKVNVKARVIKYHDGDESKEPEIVEIDYGQLENDEIARFIGENDGRKA